MTAIAIAPAALGPGSRLGPYEIIAPLRAGGMATLFLGRRVGPAGFARHVAIKVVHAHLATDPSFIEMFLDEARLAACIQHPNVVHTEELGEQDGMYYLAMEYVHGCSLAQFLMRLIEQKRGLAPEVAVHIAMKLADGLHAAHEVKDASGRSLNVVHRDISPQNVLLAYNGHVKLIDFGVAKAAGRSRETTGASLKGKIRYMSPEQAWGRSIDRRTDVYALGIVLWETLTQRRLFAAEDDFAALERVRNPQVASPSSYAPGIREALDHAVLTALAASPDARFQTAQAFRRAVGGGCPKALAVEPDDLGALLMSVMESDIERERLSAPPAVTSALVLDPPPAARRTGALAAFTREMPAYVPEADAVGPLTTGVSSAGAPVVGGGERAAQSAAVSIAASTAGAGRDSSAATGWDESRPSHATPTLTSVSTVRFAVLGAIVLVVVVVALGTWLASTSRVVDTGPEIRGTAESASPAPAVSPREADPPADPPPPAEPAALSEEQAAQPARPATTRRPAHSTSSPRTPAAHATESPHLPTTITQPAEPTPPVPAPAPVPRATPHGAPYIEEPTF